MRETDEAVPIALSGAALLVALGLAACGVGRYASPWTLAARKVAAPVTASTGARAGRPRCETNRLAQTTSAATGLSSRPTRSISTTMRSPSRSSTFGSRR